MATRHRVLGRDKALPIDRRFARICKPFRRGRTASVSLVLWSPSAARACCLFCRSEVALPREPTSAGSARVAANLQRLWHVVQCRLSAVQTLLLSRITCDGEHGWPVRRARAEEVRHSILWRCSRVPRAGIERRLGRGDGARDRGRELQRVVC